MTTIMCILLCLMPWIMGKTAVKILYGRKAQGTVFLEDELLTGGILVIGLAEAAHLGAVFLGRSVSDSAKLLALGGGAVMVLCLLLLSVFWLLGRKNGPGLPPFAPPKFPLEKRELWGLACFGVLLGIQLGCILFRKEIYLDSDMTLETVLSYLRTDGFAVHPLTGLPYQLGTPTRLKILCLPTFYADLSLLFGASPELLIWHIVPVFVLIGAYLAYSLLARVLFPDSKFYRILFMVFAAILLIVGDTMYGMEGFGLLHGGFQGVTIRGAVLMPYLLSLALRKRWRLLIFPIIGEACIVWTTYGAGMCAFMAAAVILLDVVYRRFVKEKEGAV